MDRGFFAHLESFGDFSGIADDGHFVRVPEDWHVVVSDVRGSTQAIESGRYKDVNTIGAASIVAAQNALKEWDLPCVFGGDGATVLVPEAGRVAVAQALEGLRRVARRDYGLDLRVGVVAVPEVEARGARIEVAKFELVSGQCVAVFRGGGLSLAEDLIKGDPERYQVLVDETGRPDLGGLSCRWHGIPSRNGVMLSMLVMARGDTGAVYEDVLQRLSAVFGGAPAEANPVHPELMSYNSVAENVRDEGGLAPRFSPAWFLRMLEIVVAVLIFKWKLPPLVFDPGAYAEAMRTHSDYRKFDDMLRMVIDCTPEQVAELRGYLEVARDSGDLWFGLHESDDALMTCHVDQMNDGGHIHFIDGGDGGYAMAAKELKGQMAIGNTP